MRTVLVTGATGYIGNYVIKELLRHNHRVIATSSNRKKAEMSDWYSEVEYFPFRFEDFASLINYFDFFKRTDCAIHLAWGGLPNYKSSVHTEVNLPLQRRFLYNLIENGLKDLTVTGTCLEYGMQEGCLREDMATSPLTQYAIAKDRLRKELEQLHRESF